MMVTFQETKFFKLARFQDPKCLLFICFYSFFDFINPKMLGFLKVAFSGVGQFDTLSSYFKKN